MATSFYSVSFLICVLLSFVNCSKSVFPVCMGHYNPISFRVTLSCMGSSVTDRCAGFAEFIALMQESIKMGPNPQIVDTNQGIQIYRKFVNITSSCFFLRTGKHNFQKPGRKCPTSGRRRSEQSCSNDERNYRRA